MSLKMYVHFETLVTPMYTDRTPAEVMERLDTMVNKYLTTTDATMINCVEYGFKADEETDGLQAYARLCVYMPVDNEESTNTSVEGASNDAESTTESTESNDEVVDVDCADAKSTNEEESVVVDEDSSESDNAFKSNIKI